LPGDHIEAAARISDDEARAWEFGSKVVVLAAGWLVAARPCGAHLRQFRTNGGGLNVCTASVRYAAIILVCMLSSANADDEKERARLGRVMWSAFRCATFAEMSGNEQEHERLFAIGVKAGRQFLEAIQNGQISPDAVKSEVPIGVTMLLGGPSVDFIVGRVFEHATGDAFDEIVKRKDGLPLPMSDWLNDAEVRKPKAGHAYVRGNCGRIR
jgi:hypothetical protein